MSAGVRPEASAEKDLGVKCPPESRPQDPGDVRPSTKLWIATGIFLLVLGAYALTSPGRIDMIDGEVRFDVAYNWLVTGRPVLGDKWIGPLMGVPGKDGSLYSYYGAPGSVFGMPLVRLGVYLSARDIRPSQFLFSMTSPILGAAIAPILFLFYLQLGLTNRDAVLWTMVSSFATLLWPVSDSSFDNAQHGFFVLSALFFAHLSAKRKSWICALLGGLLAGILLLYQEYFLLIIPALALATLDWQLTDAQSLSANQTGSVSRRVLFHIGRTFRELGNLVRSAYGQEGDARASCLRFCLFLAAAGVGAGLSLVYNHLRFGAWLDDGKFRFVVLRHHPISGNPFVGLLTLLVSPGKGIFFYSPALILGLVGFRQLWRRKTALAAAIAVSALILLPFLSCFGFVGGDWCWGPRYLTPLLPLCALAFPFVSLRGPKRSPVLILITLGLFVQVLALSVDHQRFFLARGLDDFFWAEDPWFYFKHSALIARPGEAISLIQGVPSTAKVFNSIPIPNWATYPPLGPPLNVPRSLAPLWIRNFQIFYLPRPWPLWMSSVSPAVRPVDVRTWGLGLLSMTLIGLFLVFRGFRVRGTT